VFARARLNGELSQENLDGAAQPRPNSTIPVNGEVCTGKAFDQKRLTQTKLMEKQPISRLFRSANIGGEAADAGFSQAA